MAALGYDDGHKTGAVITVDTRVLNDGAQSDNQNALGDKTTQSREHTLLLLCWHPEDLAKYRPFFTQIKRHALTSAKDICFSFCHTIVRWKDMSFYPCIKVEFD